MELPGGRPDLHARLLRVGRWGGPQAGAPGEGAVRGCILGEGRVSGPGVSPYLPSLLEAVQEQRGACRDDHLPYLIRCALVEVQRDYERRMRLLRQFHDGELPREEPAGAPLPGDQSCRIPRAVLPDTPELPAVATIGLRLVTSTPRTFHQGKGAATTTTPPIPAATT